MSCYENPWTGRFSLWKRVDWPLSLDKLRCSYAYRKPFKIHKHSTNHNPTIGFTRTRSKQLSLDNCTQNPIASGDSKAHLVLALHDKNFAAYFFPPVIIFFAGSFLGPHFVSLRIGSEVNKLFPSFILCIYIHISIGTHVMILRLLSVLHFRYSQWSLGFVWLLRKLRKRKRRF